jgi:hypothetical protein
MTKDALIALLLNKSNVGELMWYNMVLEKNENVKRSRG